ncbi:MAG: alcohol dehydrogenase catalytic domain-containing protein [Treponemataceae bacterium]
MKALTISGPERVDLIDIQIPQPRGDQVLVKVWACGICGSDLRSYRRGSLDFPFFGHEFSGTVVVVGTDIEDFHPGDRVAAGLFRGCGVCEPCSRGFPNFCPQTQHQFHPGGFAEFCLVTCAEAYRPIAKIPDELDDVRATLFEPLSCAMRIATRICVPRGAHILILGLGAMGMLSALLFKINNPEIFVVGADTQSGRVEIGRELGLDSCVVLEPGNSKGITDVATDFDIVVDATGAASVFPMAVDLARLGGTVILAGVPVDSTLFSPLPIFRKELTIIGAKGPFPFPNEEGGSRVLDRLLSSGIPWDRLVAVFPFPRASEAFSRAEKGDSLKSVLIWQKD